MEDDMVPVDDGTVGVNDALLRTPFLSVDEWMRLEDMQSTAHELAACTTFQEVTQRVRALPASLECAHVCVFNIDWEKGSMRLLASSVTSAEGSKLNVMPLFRTMQNSTLATTLEDAYQSPLFDPVFDICLGIRSRSLLCAPFILDPTDDTSTGLLMAINKVEAADMDEFAGADEAAAPSCFNKVDEMAAAALAHSLGRTLHTLRLVRDSNRAESRSRVLLETTRALAGVMRVTHAARVLIDGLNQMIPAAATNVFFRQADESLVCYSLRKNVMGDVCNAAAVHADGSCEEAAVDDVGSAMDASSERLPSERKIPGLRTGGKSVVTDNSVATHVPSEEGEENEDGASPDGVVASVVPGGRGIIGKVIASGQTVSIEHATVHPDFDPEIDARAMPFDRKPIIMPVRQLQRHLQLSIGVVESNMARAAGDIPHTLSSRSLALSTTSSSSSLTSRRPSGGAPPRPLSEPLHGLHRGLSAREDGSHASPLRSARLGRQLSAASMSSHLASAAHHHAHASADTTPNMGADHSLHAGSLRADESSNHSLSASQSFSSPHAHELRPLLACLSIAEAAAAAAAVAEETSTPVAPAAPAAGVSRDAAAAQTHVSTRSPITSPLRIAARHDLSLIHSGRAASPASAPVLRSGRDAASIVSRLVHLSVQDAEPSQPVLPSIAVGPAAGGALASASAGAVTATADAPTPVVTAVGDSLSAGGSPLQTKAVPRIPLPSATLPPVVHESSAEDLSVSVDAAADTQRTPALDRQPERPCVRQTVQSMLVVPIRLPNGKLVGVVQVLNKKYNRESAYAGLDDDDFGMSSRTPSASSVPASEQTARPTNTSSKEKWAAAEAFSNALQVVISASNADPNVQSPVLTATSPRVDSIPSLSLLLSSSTYTSNAPTTSSTGGLYNSSTLQLHPVASAVDVTHGMERTPDTQPESQRSADSSGRLVDEGSTSSPRPAAGDADAGDLGKSSTRPVSFTFKSAVTSPSTDDTGDAPAVLQLMRRTGRRVTLADTDSLLVSLKSLHLSEHPSDAAGAPDSGSGATSASSVEETSPAYETLHPAVTPGAVLSPDDVCLALDRFRKRVGASTSCPFTPADAAVAESLSVSVGMCFQRGVLFTSITRARRKAEALLEVVRGTRLESNFDKVLQRVLAAAYHAISADRMSVFLVDEARSELYCTYSKDIQGARLSMRNGLVGCAARTGEVVHVSDAYEDPRFDRSMDTATGYRTKSVLCLPITDNKGRVMAVLQAINKTPNASARMELPASTGSTEDGEPIPAWLNLDISSTGGTSFDSEDREILSACALEIASKLKSRSIEELLLRGEKRVARLAQRRYMSGDAPVTGTPLPGGVRVPGLALPITPAIARTASAALFTATSAGTTAMSSTNGSLLDLLEGPLRGTSGVGPSDASIPSSTSALSPAFGTHEGVAYGLADGCALPVGAAYASTYLPTMTDGFCDDDDDDAEEAVRPSLLDGSDESARSCLRPEDAVMALVSNTDTLENTRLTNGAGSLESVRHAHGLAPVATSTLVVPVPTTAASPAAGGNTFSFVGRPTRTYSGTSSVSAASAEPDSRGSSAGLVSSRRMPAAPPPYAPSHTSPTLPLRSGMTRAHSTSDVSDMDDVEGIADGGKIVERLSVRNESRVARLRRATSGQSGTAPPTASLSTPGSSSTSPQLEHASSMSDSFTTPVSARSVPSLSALVSLATATSRWMANTAARKKRGDDASAAKFAAATAAAAAQALRVGSAVWQPTSRQVHASPRGSGNSRQSPLTTVASFAASAAAMEAARAASPCSEASHPCTSGDRSLGASSVSGGVTHEGTPGASSCALSRASTPCSMQLDIEGAGQITHDDLESDSDTSVGASMSGSATSKDRGSVSREASASSSVRGRVSASALQASDADAALAQQRPRRTVSWHLPSNTASSAAQDVQAEARTAASTAPLPSDDTRKALAPMFSAPAVSPSGDRTAGGGAGARGGAGSTEGAAATQLPAPGVLSPVAVKSRVRSPVLGVSSLHERMAPHMIRASSAYDVAAAGGRSTPRMAPPRIQRSLTCNDAEHVEDSDDFVVAESAASVESWSRQWSAAIERAPDDAGLVLGMLLAPLGRAHAVDVWEFDAFQVPHEAIPLAALQVCESFGLLSRLKCSMDKLLNFLIRARDMYWSTNAFHNQYHGLHVCQATGMLLRTTDMLSSGVFPDVEAFALLLAAFCHDIDHPGVNNAFLSAIEDELSYRYNDQSILENHHAALTCELLRDVDSGTDVLSDFCLTDRRRMRQVVITSILATDMSKHFGVLIPAIKNMTQPVCPLVDKEGKPRPEMQLVKDRDRLHEVLLHAADISAQVLPWELAQVWTDAVCAEFRLQATMETNSGIPPTQHMHSLGTLLERSEQQAGFCDYVLAPMWRALGDVFPTLSDRVMQLHSNSAMYKSIAASEKAALAAAKEEAAAAAAAVAVATASTSTSAP